MADQCCSSRDKCGASSAIQVPTEQYRALPAASCGASGDACCSGGVPVFDGVDPRYKRILWTVIAINGLMFLVETVAGHVAGSQALKADALDFLADTVTYGLSLSVIGASIKARSTAALFKGLSLSVMAVWVFGSTVYRAFVLGLPSAEVMGGIGALALAANVSSVLLLMRYKDGDANVRSVWLCSRNDAIGNVVVMLAALGVWGSSSAWPDIAVAALMAGIFLTSSVQILRQGWSEYRADGNQEAGSGVVKVAVPYKDKTATIVYDDAKADVNQLSSATTRAGYPSAPKS
jgi:Co/Zn/Cd efflux system component